MSDYYGNDLCGRINNACDYFVFFQIRDNLVGNFWHLCFDVFHYRAPNGDLGEFFQSEQFVGW